MAMSGTFTDKITDLLIIGVLCVSLLGYVISNFNTMANDTTNFTTAQLAVIAVFGILIVVGILNLILRASGLKKGK